MSVPILSAAFPSLTPNGSPVVPGTVLWRHVVIQYQSDPPEVRSPKLTFSICSLGAESRTDVAIAYLADQVNEELLDTLKKKLSQLQITSLTMGSKSLRRTP